MKTLRVILGDQLSQRISSLKECHKNNDIILMCEVIEEAKYVKHHQKKIAYIFSAMRHFAEELKNQNHIVIYTKLDDDNNAGSFTSEVANAIKKHNITDIHITEPSEYRVLADINLWQQKFEINVSILPDDRFLCSKDEFISWAGSRKQLTMEYFYREMRKKYSILMQDDKPVGDKWNFDSENRKTISTKEEIPKPIVFKPDSITKEVIKLVNERFSDHFGDLEPFELATTRAEAILALKDFVENRLHNFGDYQDAMIEGEPILYHSYISFYINSGLLLPIECIKAAQREYHRGNAPLNAVEGFIRQILGWREYIRGVYWLKMPSYADENFFAAKRKLPELYWSGKTDMNCLHQCVSETKKNAYAHHIQRLMVLGNFSLLIGVDPKELNEWFLIVYGDAYEWVELPNVSGMVLFADGGFLASKPYAAGGSYINKMSNYCKNCKYKISKKTGEDACPFNYLYWNFMITNRDKLKNNYRLAMIYKSYDKMADDKKQTIKSDSEKFLKELK